MARALADIEGLFMRHGADRELVTAALLHDLGQLLDDQGESPTLRGVDDVKGRPWDDQAKSPDLPTPPPSHAPAHAQNCRVATA